MLRSGRLGVETRGGDGFRMVGIGRLGSDACGQDGSGRAGMEVTGTAGIVTVGQAWMVEARQGKARQERNAYGK
jgi:hypothetical protein